MNQDLSIASAYSAARYGTALQYATGLVVESLRRIVPSLPSPTLLDLGCGYSNILFSEWLLASPKVIGIDQRYDDVRRNPLLHLRVVGDIEKSLLAECSVDMIVSSFVMEHVEDPLSVLRECRRILKPNGVAVFCTPCLFGYKTLIAKLCGRTASDVIWKFLKGKPHPPWPDYYRANTPKTIRQLCAQSGLVLERLVFIPELPHFFHNSPLLFALARGWDRALELIHLQILHNSMAFVVRRP
jgi:2-polyprenyl-3-methyl-5-hydroxy-6-metoxy-1,4-benzoquinol methylase